MPATDRYQVLINNAVLLEAEPFEFPRSKWELLEITLSETTGWKTLNDPAVTALKALYNGAHGHIEDGPEGILVQYLAGTGGAPFTVSDWRGNSGQFAFKPDDGLVVEEVAAEGPAGATAYFRGRLRLVWVG